MSGVIAERIQELTARHGSLRAAARVLKVSPAYLSRLSRNEKEHPSDEFLRKLGIRRTITYERVLRITRKRPALMADNVDDPGTGDGE